MAPWGGIYRWNWHHDLLNRHLMDVLGGQCKRLLVMLPPGHGKSESVSRLLPAFAFGQNPDTRIIACSHTQGLAADMNRDVQRIMDDRRYAATFPLTRLNSINVRTVSGSARRNADVFDILGRRGYYKCAGVGTGITGRRFDLAVIDDPIKDREQANSPTLREAVWRWYTGVFLTRAAKDASIIICLTRWHEDDLAGRLLQKEPALWKVICLPALATGVAQHPEDPRAPGEPLWPWFKSAADLEKIHDLEPLDFAALYQQDPRPEGATEWPSSWFNREGLYFERWPDDLLMRVMALDPSKGKDAKQSDYQAHILLGRGRDGCLYVDADLRRQDIESMVQTGCELVRSFKPDGFAIETNQFQSLLVKDYQRVGQGMRLDTLPIYPVVNMVKKIVRIRRLTPYLSQGKFRFKANSPGVRLLIQQLRNFPVDDHDDGPDGLEVAVRLMGQLWQEKGGR